MIVLSVIIILKLNGQEKEIFPGEHSLENCRVNLPLTYKSKDRPIFEKAAEDYKDIKLVLVQYDKKLKIAKYKFYYVVKNYGKNQVFVYLESPESHNSTNGTKQAIFLKFRPKYDRFYKSDCFLETLKRESNLNEVIKEN